GRGALRCNERHYWIGDRRSHHQCDHDECAGDQLWGRCGCDVSAVSVYMTGYGKWAWTRNPPPALGPACSVPSYSAVRSRMPTRPCPALSVLVVPAPSSSMVTATPESRQCRVTVALACGPAWRATLVRASWTMR